MNNYQIYEEVGRGRHSTVYKGRRKRSIDYFAVASIDKSQRQRVLNSVHFLRSLDHENILKFTNWYETTNHLWVITEYCTGGSLKALLELDRGVPERCTRIFGYDIVKSLSYVHSRGVIYADLKPSNILIDDCATLRLYDFGLSQSVETAARGARVGTPAYMAPELFLDGGVHSFASDLWALGCVLFELATGKPPFVDAKLQSLMVKIVNDPTPHVDGYSQAFNDLIEGLLQKDPLQRPSWEDVLTNDFWVGVASNAKPQVSLPEQPAFDAYRKMRQEQDAKQQQQAAADDGPDRATRERDAAEVRARAVVSASMNAERNMMREIKERGGYGSAATPQALVVDREVDFTDPADADADGAGGAPGGGDGTSRPSSSQTVERQNSGASATAPQQSHAAAGGGSFAEQTSASNLTPSSSSLVPENGGAGPSRAPADQAEPSSTTKARPQSAKDAAKAGGEPVVRASLRLAPTGAKLPDTKDVASVQRLLLHPSDTQVKSIMLNSRIERIAEPRFEAQELPFPAKTAAAVRGMDTKGELESFLANIYHALSGAMSASDKLNTLCYLASLCSDPSLANMFVNSSLAGLCVKLLALPSTPANMCQMLATTLGMMLRNATFILSDVQKTGVLPTLAQASADSQPLKVRRRALGCLGELLFFVSTQSAADFSSWTVPPETGAAIIAAIGDEDEIVRHYAVKTIENIAAAGQNTAAGGPATIGFYANATAVDALIGVFTAPASAVKSEHLRASALHTALLLTMHDASLIGRLASTLPPAALYPEIMTSNSSKAVQALLLFVVRSLCYLLATLAEDKSIGEHHLVRTLVWQEPQLKAPAVYPSSLTQQQLSQLKSLILDAATNTSRLVHGIVCALESNSAAVRGKGVLAALMYTVVSEPFLGVACDMRLVAYAEKLAFDKDEYVRQCTRMWHRLLQQYAVGTMRQLAVVRQSSLHSLTQELHLVLHVVTPPTLRNVALADGTLFEAAGTGLAALAAEGFAEVEGAAEYQRSFFHLVEALTQDKTAVITHHSLITHKFLPALVPLLNSSDGAVRFSAIRLIHDIISLLVNKPQVYNPATPQAGSVGTINSVGAALLPHLPKLLTDGDPIPLYAIKVITALGDRSPTFMGKVATEEITTILTEFVEFGKPNATVFTVRGLLRVLQCSDEALMELSVKHGLVQRITGIVRAALRPEDEAGSDGAPQRGVNMGEFLDPCMEVVLFALCAAQREPTGPVAKACDRWAQSVTDLFLPLCASRHTCAECAGTCTGMLVTQFPAAATAMTSAAASVHLQEIFANIDEPASHVATEVARALAEAVDAADNVAPLLRDEILLVALEEASDYTHGFNPDCAVEIRRVLASLHKRRG